MRKRTLAWPFLLLVTIGAVAATPSPAHADFNIAVGLRWAPLRYTVPVGAGDEAGADVRGSVPGQRYTGGTPGVLYGWQTTSLDNYIAFFFTEQVGLQLSLDLGFANHTTTDADDIQFNTRFFQFGFGIGGKFYLNRPAGNKVSPYLFVNFFKYFASIGTNADLSNDVVSAIAGFYSPVGFDLAFGAEYFFTTSFSLGAEVFGLRFAHVGGSIPGPDGGRVTASENYFTFYTLISMNYRFLATARVYTYEGEEERGGRAPPQRRPRPRPIEPPPEESPESVD